MSWLRYLMRSRLSKGNEPDMQPKVRKTWTEEEIFETVADALVDALGVDRDEVTRDVSIVKDLGGE